MKVFGAIAFMLIGILGVGYGLHLIIGAWLDTHPVVEITAGVTTTIGSERSLGSVTYRDGTRLPRDGIAVEVLTWADYQKAKAEFQWPGKVPLEEDFPVVLFYNSTGFDSSGQPVAARRASDGKQIYAEPAPGPVRLLVTDGAGAYKVWGPTGSTPKVVTQAEWVRDYAAVAVVVDPKPVDQGKSGLHVTTVTVGPAGATPRPGVTIYAIGKDDLHFLNEGVNVDTIGHWTTDKDGKVDIGLPAHPYVLFAMIDGKPVGNASTPGAFPEAQVTSGWTDYEFRLPPAK